MLAVIVHSCNNILLCMPDASKKSIVLAVVTHESNAANAMVGGTQFNHILPAPIAAAVVNEHDLKVETLRVKRFNEFEDYGVYWLEEPVRADDFDGYKRIARALDLRIVGGETHFTRFDLMPFFDDPVLPILQPDPMRGGLTDLRKTAAIAESKGIKIAPHLFPELNVQLLASIPNGTWIEEMGLSADLWVEPVPIVNGMMTAPERPGHGLAFKPEILRDCRVN